MTYSEPLTNRVRVALANHPEVEEKRMFAGITFMVSDKMCISVGKDRIMLRIDPLLHESVMQKKGCITVIMRGKAYKGYVYINEEVLKEQKEFDYWIGLALEFNKKAKASKKKK